MSEDGWDAYYENSLKFPPRPLLVRALPLVGTKELALELGSGAFNDVKYLLQQGFERVIAIDMRPFAQTIADTFPRDRLDYVITRFEDYKFPGGAFDIVNAQYSLPFIVPGKFSAVFASAIASLKPGGVITGQLFGDRDGWSGDKDRNFHTADSCQALLAGLDVLHYVEEEEDQPTAAGHMKHWHVFHFIARRRLFEAAAD